MKTLMTMSVNRLVKYIKETITYYIVTMYMHSFLYRKVIVPYRILKKCAELDCFSTNDIIKMSKRKMYWYVPRCDKQRIVKNKLANEKFS